MRSTTGREHSGAGAGVHPIALATKDPAPPEWFDGSGSRHGFRGRRIPVGARILAVVDAYVTGVHDRVHRQRRSNRIAMAELEEQRGRQLDPDVVEALARVLAR